MDFDPEQLRNESEVESKLIVQFLLPALGYGPNDWHQEVALGNIRLDFLAFAVQHQPFVLDGESPLSLTIEAKSPRKSLDGFERRLGQYLSLLHARYGVLTNGRDFRIYCLRNRDLVLMFRCAGRDIAANLASIRSTIGREALRHRSPQSEPPTSALSANAIDSPPSKQPRDKTMKIIAIYHNKGGVGKTTVTINLAAGLRNLGYRVLLIDLDSQANSTFAAGLVKFQFEDDDDLKDCNVSHMLSSRDEYPIEQVVRQSQGFNSPEIDVIPAHINLIEKQYKLDSIAASRSRLLGKLGRVADRYDYVIIDTPPSRNFYAQVGVISSQYLIIPSDLRPFANQGLANVCTFLQESNEYREDKNLEPCKLLGVLPSKIATNSRFLNSTFPKQKAAITEIHKLPLFDSIIYERIALSKSLNYTEENGDYDIPAPQSIFEFAKSDVSANSSASEFEALIHEVIEKTQ
ncbi:MAG: ParA family protein [Oscillatoriales cyanobacterium]|nr:MAG: ParA family protein [Oscillatoriales cyanobacterium]